MAIVQAHVAAVQELYVAYFGRPADTAGLDYWTNVVAAQNGSTAAVSASFAKQPEYIVAYYNLTSAQIVDKIYLNMFGRGASTTDGRSYWVDLLAAGRVSIDVIVAEVANGARGTDAEAVENKVVAATAFTAALDTPAENAGYAGESALNLAKAFITGVTSDATLTSAIAPSALSGTVAAVVKAGTPFSLQTAIASFEDTNEALGDFLDDNGLTAAGASAALTADIGTAATAIQTAGVAGFASARPAVQQALLDDRQAVLEDNLASANDDLNEARADAAARPGVLAIADNLAAATAANTEASTAATAALRTQTAAEAYVEAAMAGRAVTIAANGTATIAAVAAGDPAITLIRLVDGNLVLGSGVTEARYPGVTALLSAVRANEDAELNASAAATALSDAQGEYTALSASDKLLADAVRIETADVGTAEDAIDDLSDLIADWEEAVALQTEYTTLNTAATTAAAEFTANGYVAPRALDNATQAATSGSDVFLIGDEDAVTITGFGRSGDDALFIGSTFTLGTDIDEGNNAVMEVFFVQNGTRAEIHIEQAAYGSDSGDVTVITLVGVDADDLQLTNGIITMK